MKKFLDQNIAFLFKMFSLSLAGMAFLTVFSRLTHNYEMSLVYLAIGFAIVLWVLNECFERGVGGER